MLEPVDVLFLQRVDELAELPRIELQRERIVRLVVLCQGADVRRKPGVLPVL